MLRVTSDMTARAVWAYRNSTEDHPDRRMKDALEYALAGVQEDPAERRLQELIAQFRKLLEQARAALEELQAKLLALTALGAPNVVDAELVEDVAR